MNLNKLAIILAVIGLLAVILTGFLQEYLTSIIILIILFLFWIAWITKSIIRINSILLLKKGENLNRSNQSLLPYKPHFSAFEREITLINSKKKKIKIPSEFLDWPHFTILFWVNITSEFIETYHNRYIFSYTTDTKTSSKYPNAFYLRLTGGGDEWIFMIKGENPENKNKISFGSSESHIGWKLMTISWDRYYKKLLFLIDAGHTYKYELEIETEYWPKSNSEKLFHLGGWQDSWDGGLSILEFFKFRIFNRRFSMNEISTLYVNEKKKHNLNN